MLSRFYLGINFVNGPVLVNKVGNPAGALIFAAHELLGTPHAIGREHFMTFVAEHGVIEALLFNEFALFSRRIGADADYLDATLFELPEFITESLAFNGSAGGAGLGEKPQYDLPAAEVLQGNQLFIGIGQGEIGGG